MLDERRLGSLAESIERNGLRFPIVLFDGQILDGRNRHRAAGLLGVELGPADFTDFEGDYLAAVEFVVDTNLERRDLLFTQRVKAADELATLANGQRREGRATAAAGGKAPSRDGAFSVAEAAKQLKVGPATVERRRAVRERGVPELLEKADAGEVGYLAASHIAKLAPEEQRQAVAGGAEAVKAAAKRGAAARLREPKPPVALSPAQKAVRERARAEAVFAEAAKLNAVLTRFATSVSESNLSFSADQRELGRDFGAQLVSTGQWIQTMFSNESTGVTDESLARLLEGESE